MEPRRQPRRIIVRAPKRDDRRGANHHEHQCDERREDEDPDRQAFLHRVRVPPRLAAARFPDPFAARQSRAL